MSSSRSLRFEDCCQGYHRFGFSHVREVRDIIFEKGIFCLCADHDVSEMNVGARLEDFDFFGVRRCLRMVVVQRRGTELVAEVAQSIVVVGRREAVD